MASLLRGARVPPPPADHAPRAPQDPRAFLEHFPQPRRSTIANWWHYGVRAGVQTPVQVLQAVHATCRQRLARGASADATLVLAALDGDQAGALGYAQWVITYEALPYDARQRVKAERTFAALKDAMQGKAATEAQVRYLAALGYRVRRRQIVPRHHSSLNTSRRKRGTHDPASAHLAPADRAAYGAAG